MAQKYLCAIQFQVTKFEFDIDIILVDLLFCSNYCKKKHIEQEVGEGAANISFKSGVKLEVI